MAAPKLLRGIGRWDLVALFLNAIIGAGIFGLPAHIHALVGSHALLVYFGCAVVVALIMLCFVEAASRFRETGGPYLYASVAFGPAIGFQVGWLTWLSRVFAFAALANLAVDYLAHFGGALDGGIWRSVLLTGVVVILAGANVSGVRTGITIVNVFTVGKLMPLVFFIVVGVSSLAPAELQPREWPGVNAMSSALLLLVFAFTGFEKAFVPAGETRDPERAMPFAALTALATVAVLYILIHAVTVSTLPDLANSPRPLADAADRLIGPTGGIIMVAGAAISVIGSLNGNMLAAPRLLFAMAERGQLPAPLAAVHQRYRTPHVAIVVTAAVMLAVSLSGSFLAGVAFSTLARLLSYGLTCAAIPVLRRRGVGTSPAFRVPGGGLIPAVALAWIGVLLATVSLVQWRDVALAIAFGALVFVGTSRGTHRKTIHVPPTSDDRPSND